VPRGDPLGCNWLCYSVRILCSTPFGITEFRGAIPGRTGVQLFAVLNAFRHHGVSRRGQDMLHQVPERAQRLSASRSFAGVTTGRMS